MKKDYIKLTECNCFAMRLSARHITQYYESHLRESGLKATQFNILSIIKLSGELTVSQLSEKTGIERTGLTRNLKIIEKNGWVLMNENDQDRRIRNVSLSDEGNEILLKAIPLWEKAQNKLDEKLGHDFMESLRNNLDLVISSKTITG